MGKHKGKAETEARRSLAFEAICEIDSLQKILYDFDTGDHAELLAVKRGLLIRCSDLTTVIMDALTNPSGKSGVDTEELRKKVYPSVS